MIRGAGAVRSLVVESPGSLTFLGVIGLLMLVLSTLNDRVTEHVLRRQSTNLVEMTRGAPRVLLVSAFLSYHVSWLSQAVLFAVVMVPVERWIGTGRWLLVVVTGHVGASVFTTVMIWALVRHGTASPSMVYPIDVGSSYALAAAAAVLVYRFGRSVRFLLLGVALVRFGLPLVTSRTFTDVGHAVAFVIGGAAAPFVQPVRRPVGARTRFGRWVNEPGHAYYVLSAALILIAISLFTVFGSAQASPTQLPPTTERLPTIDADAFIGYTAAVAAAVAVAALALGDWRRRTTERRVEISDRSP
ncbi:MAG: rhomboid-like protein [Acidimicrobiia bacterium]